MPRGAGRRLVGGRLHADCLTKLDVVADFLGSLRAPDGKMVPVIFRPFHEHNGDWFWWGRAHAGIDEFKTLWRFTVSHLRDDRRVHNLLYAYSIDVFDSEAEYLERYTGDEVIDLLGIDDYRSVEFGYTRCTLVNRLWMLSRMAHDRGKLAALTETGAEAIPRADWWTGVLLPALKAPEAGQEISYVLAWRNANHAHDRKNHFYVPFKGHPGEADFVRFKQYPFVLFEDGLPPLYHSLTAPVAPAAQGDAASGKARSCD